MMDTEVPGGGGSTVNRTGMENPGGGGQTGKRPPWAVWIFSGTTH